MSKQKRGSSRKPAPAKQQRRSGRSLIPSMGQSFLTDFNAAGALMRQRRWLEARTALDALAARYPYQPDVLRALVNVNFELHDLQGYQQACERLIKLVPDDPDLTAALAGAYMANIFPMLALRTFRRFLDRWPQHPRAGEARATLADLEAKLPEIVASLGLSGEAGVEVATLHEEARSLLDRGDWPQARKVAEQLLQRRPDFVPALNNLSQMEAAEGGLDQAIATAQRALAVAPGNVHALSNLTRYLLLSGRLDEARLAAERLKAGEPTGTDVWTKKAEALSYLGDDQGVLDALRGAEQAGGLRPPLADSLLYHLAAVAALRLGREDEARRSWQKALQLAPGLAIARENLADLDKPVGERHAPWAFSLVNWVPRNVIAALGAQLESSRRGGDRMVTQALHRYLREHPEIARLLPILLDRGDPQARELAWRLAFAAKTPELLAALRDFALSQRGPDDLRWQAAAAAVDAGLLPAGPIRQWLGGEWREMLPLSFDIHDEVVHRHPPRVDSLSARATAALKSGDSDTAERLLQQALEMEPDAPDLQHNLAAVYLTRGQTQEGEALIRRIHERHPDYFFARVSLACLLIQRGDLDAAKALIDPLLSRRRLHRSEFGALCGAQIDLLLAQGNRDAARSWLGLWESADHDNPLIAHFRRRLNPPGRRKGLFGQRPS